jgi:hypothetical protein
MKVQDHTIIDPLFGAVYTIPEEFPVGSDDFERCCGNIFREIISRKIHWHIPLTDLETFFDNTLDDAAANIDDLLNDEEFLLYEQHCLQAPGRTADIPLGQYYKNCRNQPNRAGTRNCR